MIGFANTSAALFSARAVLISPRFQCVHCDSKNKLGEKTETRLASEENRSDSAPEQKSPSLALNLKQLVNVATAQGILYSAKWLMSCFWPVWSR